MIAIDTNILVYAHRPEAPFHSSAREVLRRTAESEQRWSIPFHCLVEFAAIATNTRIWKKPSRMTDVGDQVAAWLESPSVTVLGEDGDSWPNLLEALSTARASGGAVHDARIAACCRFHRVTELWTVDRDFSRFPWLKVKNPLRG